MARRSWLRPDWETQCPDRETSTIDKRLRAFDSHTGKQLWEARLDSEGHTNPMTYMARNGKQYVVIVSSGLNAYALE